MGKGAVWRRKSLPGAKRTGSSTETRTFPLWVSFSLRELFLTLWGCRSSRWRLRRMRSFLFGRPSWRPSQGSFGRRLLGAAVSFPSEETHSQEGRGFFEGETVGFPPWAGLGRRSPHERPWKEGFPPQLGLFSEIPSGQVPRNGCEVVGLSGSPSSSLRTLILFYAFCTLSPACDIKNIN